MHDAVVATVAVDRGSVDAQGVCGPTKFAESPSGSLVIAAGTRRSSKTVGDQPDS